MAKIITVDENDRMIGWKERKLLNTSDIYRVTALWATNPQEKILLAKRALTKKHDPGKWGPAVSGTVEKGEKYSENIAKETEEEIGLVNCNFKKADKVRIFGKHAFFLQLFKCTIDKNLNKLIIQKEEVMEIRWFTKDEIKKIFQKDPGSFLTCFEKILKVFDLS